jgi:hypothetical protein
MATAREVAQWMSQEVEKSGILEQEVAAFTILKKFGEEFTYTNDNGNIAIARNVLAEFRKLTDKTVVWERGERLWRKRHSFDDKAKRQVD